MKIRPLSMRLSSRRRREIRRHVAIYAGLAPFIVIAVFPIAWMAITAFKEEADLYRTDQFPFWFHLAPTLENFKILFFKTYFGPQLVNTALLVACVVLITLVTAVPAGYVLTRLRLPGAEILGIAIFITYLVPSIVLFLPLSRPGMLIAGIFAFTLSLHEFLYAVVYVSPRDQKTVTVGIATALIRGDIFYWGSLMAAGLLVGLPVAILYVSFIDHFIQGLTGTMAE